MDVAVNATFVKRKNPKVNHQSTCSAQSYVSRKQYRHQSACLWLWMHSAYLMNRMHFKSALQCMAADEYKKLRTDTYKNVKAQQCAKLKEFVCESEVIARARLHASIHLSHTPTLFQLLCFELQNRTKRCLCKRVLSALAAHSSLAKVSRGFWGACTGPPSSTRTAKS